MSPLQSPSPVLLGRAAALAIGLALLLVVNVTGTLALVAWTLIGLALITELIGSIVYLRRRR